MKELHIYRGLPGSGKTTAVSDFATKLHRDGEFYSLRVVSTDHYFLDHEGAYCFDIREMGNAHAQCFKRAIEGVVHAEYDYVIVDNTNTTILEMAPYYLLAQAYGYKVKIYFINHDLETCVKRNVHGVSEDVIRAMMDQFDTELPPYWDVEYHALMWDIEGLVPLQ